MTRPQHRPPSRFERTEDYIDMKRLRSEIAYRLQIQRDAQEAAALRIEVLEERLRLADRELATMEGEESDE